MRIRDPTLFAKDPHYAALVREMEAVGRHYLFGSLADRAGRSELMAGLIGRQPCEALYVWSGLTACLGLNGHTGEFGGAQ